MSNEYAKFDLIEDHKRIVKEAVGVALDNMMNDLQRNLFDKESKEAAAIASKLEVAEGERDAYRIGFEGAKKDLELATETIKRADAMSSELIDRVRIAEMANSGLQERLKSAFTYTDSRAASSLQKAEAGSLAGAVDAANAAMLRDRIRELEKNNSGLVRAVKAHEKEVLVVVSRLGEANRDAHLAKLDLEAAVRNRMEAERDLVVSRHAYEETRKQLSKALFTKEADENELKRWKGSVSEAIKALNDERYAHDLRVQVARVILAELK